MLKEKKRFKIYVKNFLKIFYFIYILLDYIIDMVKIEDI